MAKLTGRINFGEVARLAKYLDYYQWKGIWCVRYYPPRITQPATPQQKTTWNNFRETLTTWNKYGVKDRNAWRTLVAESNYTAKDYFSKNLLLSKRVAGSYWVTIRYVNDTMTTDPRTLIVSTNPPTRLRAKITEITTSNQKPPNTWKRIGRVIRGGRIPYLWGLTEHYQLVQPVTNYTLAGINTFLLSSNPDIYKIFLRLEPDPNFNPAIAKGSSGLFLFYTS